MLNPGVIPLIADNVWQNEDGIGTLKFFIDSLDISRNTTFSSIASRIRGDLSNVTYANRLLFQTSVTDSYTAFGLIPNGTHDTSVFTLFNSSSPDNSSIGSLTLDAGNLTLQAGKIGSGIYVPILFNTGGATRLILDVNGYLGINEISPQSAVDLYGDIRIQNITTPADTTNRLYATGGNLYWNTTQLNGVASSIQNLSQVLAQGNSASSYQIDMNNNKIINVGTPTSSGDASNKYYVDETVITYTSAASANSYNQSKSYTDTASGNLINYIDSKTAAQNELKEILANGNDANNIQIKNLGTPTLPQDAATKNYVDTTSAQASGNSYNQCVTYTNAASANLQNQVNLINNIFSVIKDPTGFDTPENVVINYDPANQKVTLTGSFNAYWQGRLISVLTSGWVSSAHTNSSGHTYFLYYDGSNFQWATDSYPGFNNLLIALVNYGSTDKYAIRECHGLSMSWADHQEDHETIGTYRQSGGSLSGYTLNSTTAANRRPDVAATYVKDEDLITLNPALTSKQYNTITLASTGSGTITYSPSASDIVPLSGNQPYYNQFTGGSWQQTLVSNGNYMSIWLIAMPVTASATSQKYRYLWMQGQSNGTLISEQSLIPANLTLGNLQLESSEFIFLAKIIIRYNAANWSLIEVNNLTGNKFSQIGSPAGVYLSSVAVDSTLTGDGSLANPLSVVQNYVTLTGTQTVSGEKTFYNQVNLNNNKIINVATPTASGDAANKYYVDSRDESVSGNLINYINSQDSNILSQSITYTNTVSGNLANTLTAQTQTYTNNASGNLVNYIDYKFSTVPTSTPALSAVLAVGNDANGNRIINAADPVNNQDVATKAYVDTHSSSGGTTGGSAFISGTLGVAVSAGQPVYQNSNDGLWYLAQATQTQVTNLSITVTAGVSGNIINFMRYGNLTGLSSLPSSSELYLSQSTAGLLTNVLPTSGVIAYIGVSRGSTILDVAIGNIAYTPGGSNGSGSGGPRWSYVLGGM